jgi:protein gp37
VSSLADVFEDHAMVAPWRAEALELLASCTSLDVQLLTKRPEHIRAMVPPAWLESWPAHVWIGTTVEDQKRANERIPHLLNVPAAVRFLSMEPLLEHVDLDRWVFDREAAIRRAMRGPPAMNREQADDYIADMGISWVIVGGESGPGARPFDLAWARSVVAQCDAAGVPVFVKQMGAKAVGAWGDADRHPFFATRWQFVDRAGADPAEWPEDLRRQSFPVSP